jgi:iron(III) transport system substrate-binding protein
MLKESSARTIPIIVLVLVFNLIFAFSILAQDQKTIDAAKKEGKIVAYTSMDNKTLQLIMNAFEQKYGISGSFFRGNTTAVLDRALTEYRAGKVGYDLVITADNPMRVMQQQGLFRQYVSPSSKFYDKEAVDPFFGPRYRSVILGIVYNSKLLKESEAPKSYNDLLDPRWKGKLTTSDPTRHTTTTEWFASLHHVFGSKEKANAWIEGFAAQQPVLVENLRPSIRRIGSGESLAGIGYMHHVFIYGREGAPLDYVKRLPVYLGEGHYIAASSKAPRPHAAQLFIDFFLGQESMEIMAKGGEFVNRSGVYPPLPGAEQVVKRFKQVDAMTREEYAEKRKEYARIFKK